MQLTDFNMALRLPPNKAQLGMVRHVVRLVLTDSGMKEPDIDDLVTIAGELTTNSVRHADTPAAYGVELDLRDGLATIIVSDNGRGFTRDGLASLPGQARPGGCGPEQERFGGWGLPLVEKLADTVAYRQNEPGRGGGMTVEARKRI